jgi:hypothetical protein
MRKDMSKVIIDTYRYGSAVARAVVGTRRKYRNRLDADGEGGLKRIGMHGDIFLYQHRKEPGDRIGPLKRYLKRQVFRPWNDVYSEVCAVAKLDSVTQWHLRLHLVWLVEVNTVMLDGEVVLTASSHHWPVAKSSCEVYVHPVTGLLMPVLKIRRRQTPG